MLEMKELNPSAGGEKKRVIQGIGNEMYQKVALRGKVKLEFKLLKFNIRNP